MNLDAVEKILLFSGKRKSGKDFITEKLLNGRQVVQKYFPKSESLKFAFFFADLDWKGLKSFEFRSR